MTSRRILLFLLFPALLPAANKEMIELQRDVAQLQDQVRTLQRTVDERFAALTTLIQQSLDASNRASSSVATLEGHIGEQLRQQSDKVTNPVANVGAKIDQMTTEFQAVRESVSDVTARMGKLEQQMLDLSNSLKTMQSPAAPPPPVSSSQGPGSASSGAPPVAAETLYQNAYRDMTGNNASLALQEFTDYLKYYGSTPYAPNAQYYLGDIYFRQQDYDNALKAFDLVLEKFPENNKSADARYMKGLTLLRLNRRNAAVAEFQEIVRRYPASENATRARAQLKQLGINAPATAAARRSRR